MCLAAASLLLLPAIPRTATEPRSISKYHQSLQLADTTYSRGRVLGVEKKRNNIQRAVCALWGAQVPSTVKPMTGVVPTGDKLVLRGLLFYGVHGVKPEEKKLGQKFSVDVDAWMDLQLAGETDDLTKTVSYTDIYRIVKDIVEGPSHNLLESVAHHIANTTMKKYPQISAIRVKVGKPHVAVRGPVDFLGVEILRYNNQTA